MDVHQTSLEYFVFCEMSGMGVALPGVRIKPDIVRLFDCMSGQNKRCPSCPAFVRLFTFRKQASTAAAPPSVAERRRRESTTEVPPVARSPALCRVPPCRYCSFLD